MPLACMTEHCICKFILLTIGVGPVKAPILILQKKNKQKVKNNYI
jgi:hypothetical protein